jgi:hypothetical protein
MVGSYSVVRGIAGQIVDYHPGWLLIIVGLVIATIGLVWLLAPSVPWFGRLPGDIVIERANSRFYFPVTTCIIVSLLLSGLMWLVRRLGG